jgi:predicted DsbA family dithiol-disulfide isomerase
VRLRRLEEKKGERVAVEWRSFLLRPRPDPSRTLEKFREYTRSWLRPAADVDAGNFRVWQSDAGPPSHSIPPHLVAKAAASLGADAFRRVHEALLHAYFHDNRDISDDATLRAIWEECDLPVGELVKRDDPEILRRVVAEHNEALEHGATGVPAVRVEGGAGIVVGAHPYDLYDRWVTRLLEAADT